MNSTSFSSYSGPAQLRSLAQVIPYDRARIDTGHCVATLHTSPWPPINGATVMLSLPSSGSFSIRTYAIETEKVGERS